MKSFVLIVVMILLASFARIIPHPPNFTPIAALGLFGAATLANKKLALILPLMLMFISDCCLELVSYLGLTQGWMAQGWGFHEGMFIIYPTVFLITCMGLFLRENQKPFWVVMTTLSASLLFFLITNFAVWVMQDLYPKSWEGLIQCYVMAIPFFAYTALGDLFYVTVLFGLYSLATYRIRRVSSQNV